jgi:ribonuclease inhibitor
MSTEILLDGSAIKSEADFYFELSKKRKLPDYFGNNLNALWDVITGFEICSPNSPIDLVWDNSIESKKHLGNVFDELVGLLREAEEKKIGLKLVLR